MIVPHISSVCSVYSFSLKIQKQFSGLMRLSWCETVRSSCLTLILILLAQCSHTSCKESEGALTVVDNPDDVNRVDIEDEASDEEDDEDMEVFHPTNQWQTLKPGQAVPSGSHVRLNLQSGQREVRLGEEQLKYWTQKHSEDEDKHPFIDPDELKKAMKKIKEDLNVNKNSNQEESVSSQFRPLEELKKDMAQLDLLVETDTQILRRLLNQYNSTRSTEERLNILHDLEYMVHQVDNAQNLCSMGGLVFIFEGLNSSDSRLQESSAFVLGSALSSNPTVQVKAVEGGALQTLLTLLATTKHFPVQKKVLFAVACLLRNFPFAQQHFLSNGGLQVMSEVFQGDGNGSLRTRIVTLLHDLIIEKDQISKTNLESLGPTHEERVRQYSRVTLDRELMETNWCSLIPQLLHSSEHDYREKALQTLIVMTPMCLEHYRTDQSLLTTLTSLKAQYKEMMAKENSVEEEMGYFGEIVELIENLQIKIR